MTYSGKAPSGASQFEEKFGLAPLSDADAKIERAERLLSLFIDAAADSSSNRATVWMGTFSPSEVTVPVPASDDLERSLNSFRSAEEISARQELAAIDDEYDYRNNS